MNKFASASLRSRARGRASTIAAGVAVCTVAFASSAVAQDKKDPTAEDSKDPTAQDSTDPTFVSRDESGNLTVANDAAGFGSEGQWTFSTDAALEYSRQTQDGSEATTKITFLPATDYFVMENVSVGGVIGVVYTKAGGGDSTSFTLGPRVGYNFEISPLLSVWPKLGFSYAHKKTDDVKNDAVSLNLFAPVMLHPAPHFFAGFGPFLETDLNGDNRSTTWGFRLTLGGWI